MGGWWQIFRRRLPREPARDPQADAVVLAWRVGRLTGVTDPGPVEVLTEIIRRDGHAAGTGPVERLPDDALAVLADRAVSLWADLGHPGTLAAFDAITSPRAPYHQAGADWYRRPDW